MGKKSLERGSSCGELVQQDITHLIALTKIDRIGPVTARALVSHFGDVKEVFRATPKLLRTIPQVGERLAAAISKSEVLRSAESELKFAEKNNVQVRSIYDEDYPWMLRNIYDAPMVLFQKGCLEFNGGLNVAIVGTRKPSPYGRITAERVARYLSERGVNVVSGLAYGIDGEAHDAVLRTGGKTTAVLGHGLGTIYPREHLSKAMRIGENGALITEFHSEVGPDGRNFPLRNRIISGLCHATLVVEAGETGGALITARMAFQQNREVYAVPGDLSRKTSIGCNRLIRDQMAKIFTHPQELIDDLLPMLEKKKRGDREAAARMREAWRRQGGKREGMGVGWRKKGGEMLTGTDRRQRGRRNGAWNRVGDFERRGNVVGKRMDSGLNISGLAGKEREVVECLMEGEQSIDQLAERVGESSSALRGILLKLEIRGLLRQGAGGICAIGNGASFC